MLKMFSKLDLLIGAAGIRLVRKYRNFRKIPDIVFVKKNLAFGGYTPYDDLKKLKIDFVLDLREEKPKPTSSNMIDYQKIGIPDGKIPEKFQIKEIISILQDKLDAGRTVFIHCNLGRGRATLITLLYLIHDGMDQSSALKLVRKRPFVYLNRTQLNFIKNFSD